MEDSPQYLLDTNIVVAVTRGGGLGRHVENTYRLTALPFRPLICVVSIGETLKLAKQFNWGEEKIDRVKALMANLVCVDVNDPLVLEAYAEIAHFCESTGKKMPQNDYWIAASACVTQTQLLTTDTDFDRLHGRFITRIWVDEALGKP